MRKTNSRRDDGCRWEVPGGLSWGWERAGGKYSRESSCLKTLSLAFVWFLYLTLPALLLLILPNSQKELELHLETSSVYAVCVFSAEFSAGYSASVCLHPMSVTRLSCVFDDSVPKSIVF